MTTYIVEVRQNGRVIKTERIGSSEAARSIANEWRARGYNVRVTDDHNASYPY
jgi:hypothetical protein